MFFDIYFCADGVLRAEQHPEKPLIDLTFIQKHSHLHDDFSFWVQWWTKNVYFEKGLTIASFFSCLEPWTEFFSTLTNVDIKSYITELRQPCSLEKQSSFNYIEISSEMLFDPELVHTEKIDLEDLFKELSGGPKEKRLMQLTGLWNKTQRIMVNGFKLNDIHQRYAFNFSHPEYFANTPLILNNKKQLSLFNHGINRYMEKEIPVFHDDMPCLIKCSSGFNTLIYEDNYTFREIVEAFFSELKHKPQDMRNFDNMLQQRIISISQEEKRRAIEKEVEKSNSSNVVSIHKNHDSKKSQIDNKKDNNLDKNNVQVIMTSDFLTDLGNLGKKEVDFWDYLLDKASHDNTILRIGKVEKQPVPHKRVFGKIIEDKDYIQPSDPKLL